MLFNVGNHLSGLVINGRETRLPAERETIHFGSDDTEPVFRQTNERKEDLVRHAQAGNEE